MAKPVDESRGKSRRGRHERQPGAVPERTEGEDREETKGGPNPKTTDASPGSLNRRQREDLEFNDVEPRNPA
jgi:hypothetical protein